VSELPGVIRNTILTAATALLAAQGLGPVRLVAQTTVSGIIADVGTRGGASVHWDAVPGATSYFVVRWNTNDVACCKKISPPTPAAPVLTWQDDLLQAGTYAYRVYATTPNATYAGEVRVNFVPGTVNSSTTFVASPGGSIQQTSGGTGSPVIASAAQPQTLVVQLAGPAQLAASNLVPGWGILLNWPIVPNAAGYRVQRTIIASGVPGAPINALDRGPRAARGFSRALDIDIAFQTTYTYWVEAVFADGSASAPSPVTAVKSGLYMNGVSNLRSTVGGTTSIVMPAPASVLGAMPGSQVTFEWDPLPGVYRYEFSYEIVGGVQPVGSVVERSLMMTTGEPPVAGPVVRPVPQGKSVKFCVSTIPQGGDPSQPLSEFQLFGQTVAIGPVRCITTQVP
jgi:hypothetical protein